MDFALFTLESDQIESSVQYVICIHEIHSTDFICDRRLGPVTLK